MTSEVDVHTVKYQLSSVNYAALPDGFFSLLIFNTSRLIFSVFNHKNMFGSLNIRLV